MRREILHGGNVSGPRSVPGSGQRGERSQSGVGWTSTSLDRDLAAAGVPAEQRTTLAFGIGYGTAVLRWFGQLPDSMNRDGGAPAG